MKRIILLGGVGCLLASSANIEAMNWNQVLEKNHQHAMAKKHGGVQVKPQKSLPQLQTTDITAIYQKKTGSLNYETTLTVRDQQVDISDVVNTSRNAGVLQYTELKQNLKDCDKLSKIAAEAGLLDHTADVVYKAYIGKKTGGPQQ